MTLINKDLFLKLIYWHAVQKSQTWQTPCVYVRKKQKNTNKGTYLILSIVPFEHVLTKIKRSKAL